MAREADAAAAAPSPRTQLEDAGGQQRLHASERGAHGACGTAEQRVRMSTSAFRLQRPQAPAGPARHRAHPGKSCRASAPACTCASGRTRRSQRAARVRSGRAFGTRRLPCSRRVSLAHPSDSRYAVSAVSESMDAIAPGRWRARLQTHVGRRRCAPRLHAGESWSDSVRVTAARRRFRPLHARHGGACVPPAGAAAARAPPENRRRWRAHA